MQENIKNNPPETICSPDLLEEIKYDGDQSPDFDALLKSGRKVFQAHQDSLSEVTSSGILFSGWHVPCHCIVVRTESGECQAFHVQPNKNSASLLTFEQEKALKEYKDKKAKFIAAKGIRGWFDQNDAKELERMGIQKDKVIDVDTAEWWRLLYDPQIDQVWVDIKDKHILLKYQGFGF